MVVIKISCYLLPYLPIKRFLGTQSQDGQKNVLQWSGINTDKFKPHSTRGVSTSKASALGIDVNLLLRQASWKNAETFRNFYNKTENGSDFGT